MKKVSKCLSVATAFSICSGVFSITPMKTETVSASNFDLSFLVESLQSDELEKFELIAHSFGYDNAFLMLQNIDITSNNYYTSNIVDLNDDGDYDVEDVMIILSFCNGNYRYAIEGENDSLIYRNIIDMDVNEDRIINSEDAWLYFEVYTALLSHNIPNFEATEHHPLNSYQEFEANNFYLNRQYYKCELTSNGEIDSNSISNYQIQWDNERSNNINTLRTDSRTYVNSLIDSPLECVVRLSNSGTGFIIDEHSIATAAHCIYNSITNSFVPVNVLIYDSNMNLVTTIIPTSLHIPYQYAFNQSDPQPSSNYDYGLITVDDSIDLTTYGTLSFGVSTYDLMSTSKPVTDCGFMMNDNILHRYQTQGYLVNWVNDLYQNNEYPFVFLFNITSISGCSGAPLYTTVNNSSASSATPDSVLGIVTGGAYNYGLGIRVMPTVLRFYYQNPYFNAQEGDQL